MIGLKTHVRVDNSLYTDHETAAERTKREVKEAKAVVAAEKAAAEAEKKTENKKGGKGKGGGDGGGKAANGKKSFFRITVTDNGKVGRCRLKGLATRAWAQRLKLT